MPLTGEDWTQIAAWTEKRTERLYGHLLLNRLFRATITAVNLSVVPYQVQIQRVGESQSDGAWYACLSGFIPIVGDAVELCWQDDKVAIVLGMLTRTSPYLRYRTKAHATSATTIVNNGPLTAFTTVILNTVDWDPNGDFNPVTYTYQPKLPGIYRFAWRCAINAGAGGPAILRASLFKNNVEVAAANGYAGATFEIDVTGTDSQTMNGSTDFVNLGATQNSGANTLSLIGAADTAMLSAELVSTL